jgi:hypothetical protein
MTFGALLSVYQGDQPVALATCLESLVWQTDPLDAVLVVVEGTLSPEIESVLTHYSSPLAAQGFAVLRIPRQNGPLGFGLPASLNEGLQALSTDWVLKVDTDDINVPTRVAETRAWVEAHPNGKLVGAQLQEWSEGFAAFGPVRRVHEPELGEAAHVGALDKHDRHAKHARRRRDGQAAGARADEADP